MMRAMTCAWLLALWGCDSLSGPRVTVFPSMIDTAGAAIVLPDSIPVGEPFDVLISTGIGGCDSVGPTEIRVDVRVVLVPFDVETIHDGILCPGFLKYVTRAVEITWPTAGEFDVDVRAIDAWTAQPSVFTRRLFAYD